MAVIVRNPLHRFSAWRVETCGQYEEAYSPFPCWHAQARLRSQGSWHTVLHVFVPLAPLPCPLLLLLQYFLQVPMRIIFGNAAT
jgi:hypothetical protein